MKGINFMIELAISVLIMSIFVFFLYKNFENKVEIEKYKDDVFHSLNMLDKSGKLRFYVFKNDVNWINHSLSKILKGNINYSIVLLNKTTNITEIPQIYGKDVVVVDYVLCGDFDNYSPRKIKVFIWK
ncbi:MAG: hypothetical protein N3E38_00655 [Candidatus Aenigmarchaeota archaeon]|nr:hypothetical protein [Candidatus Aenigmarchaeota archaeon]